MSRKDQYINNLMHNLVMTNGLLDVYKRIPGQDAFVNFTSIQLGAKDVHRMNPATLGKIMCSFEIGEVLPSREELLGQLSFSGDCEALFRELVSKCLAHAIYASLVFEEQAQAREESYEYEKFQ